MSTAARVPGTGRDAGIAWHYGDPLREQRQLITGAGVVDRGNRDVLTVTGPDRLGWLHSICSQHVSELPDGAATEALVLSAHGHVEQHWQLAHLDGTIWLDTEPGAGPEVLTYLHKMQFLKRVESRDVSPDWAVVSLLGPRATQVLDAAGFDIPDVPGTVRPRAAGGFVRRVASPDGYDLLVPAAEREQCVELLCAAGAAPAGSWALDALRVDQRIPRLGLETDHRTIPHEVGWIGSAVHLNKGCYRGQETVARVQNLGRPPRRLVLLHLSGESDELPEPGTAVEVAGRVCGFVGTAVQHYELGPVALAVVKRSLTADAVLQVGVMTATIDDSVSAARSPEGERL